MNSLEVFSFQSIKVINWEDDVAQAFITAIEYENFELMDHDVVVITSKVVSMEHKSAVEIETITPSQQAMELSELSSLDPKLAQIVIDESDGIYGAVFHAILAKTPYGLSANAGIDISNSPEGWALLLPREPDMAAEKIRSFLIEKTGKDIAVIITDSRTIPLRKGTTAVSIGISGMDPLIDERGKKDLYGYTMSVTTRAIADNIATAANLLMGETAERRPFAVVRGFNYPKIENANMERAHMPEDQCLYFAPLLRLIEGRNE